MTVNNRSELGKILKQRRLAVPLTLQELASAAQVSASHIGRIERGERFPSAHILRRMAKPLHIKEVELMSLAGFLSPEPDASGSTSSMQLDPYVSMMLSQEPVELQRAVVAVLILLKGMARSL
jgi:transcriptional regulator with XRE-family HTH domain